MYQATLTKAREVNRAHPNIHLLRRVINAVHSGSPDDSHMAIRYAKFLGIMVQIAVPVASSSPDVASGEETGEGSHDTDHGGFEEDAYVYTFDNVAVEGVGDWDALLGLELTPDLFTWWESMHVQHAFTHVS